jgi:hypothetical protein
MISRNLGTAIAETMQAHSERYHQGKGDLKWALSALGNVAADHLGRISCKAERDRAFRMFLSEMFAAADRKANRAAERSEQQQ